MFPGARYGKPLSKGVLYELLTITMQRSELTVHGFRSTFSTWASEETEHSQQTIEMALAHTITNAVEKAYRRGNLFEKRRKLMNDWSNYCYQPSAVMRLVAI